MRRAVKSCWEREKLIMEENGTGLREDRAPPPTPQHKREKSERRHGEFLSYGFLKQEVKSQGKEFERITSGRRQKWIRKVALPGRVGDDLEFVMMLVCSTIELPLTGLPCLVDGCCGETRA